jgi:hypothetical protein
VHDPNSFFLAPIQPPPEAEHWGLRCDQRETQDTTAVFR